MRRKALGIVSAIFKLALAAVYLAPTWMVLVNSFKEKKLANRFGTGFPEVWRFSNYHYNYAPFALVSFRAKLYYGCVPSPA